MNVICCSRALFQIHPCPSYLLFQKRTLSPCSTYSGSIAFDMNLTISIVSLSQLMSIICPSSMYNSLSNTTLLEYRVSWVVFYVCQDLLQRTPFRVHYYNIYCLSPFFQDLPAYMFLIYLDRSSRNILFYQLKHIGSSEKK